MLAHARSGGKNAAAACLVGWRFSHDLLASFDARIIAIDARTAAS
jgi:hypothetical protein